MAWPKLNYLYAWQLEQHLDESPLMSGFIKWFCNLPENKLLLEIPSYFLLDWYAHQEVREYCENKLGFKS